MGCFRCQMFGMWNPWDVRFSKCWMLGMWDVRCAIFSGVWDFHLQNAKNISQLVENIFLIIYSILVGMLIGPTHLVETSGDVMRAISTLSVEFK